MALVLDRPRNATVARAATDWVVPAAIIVAVALRLPFLAHAASPDEAGFLMVGGQWHAGGTALYGNYWVDRPPLLIGIFQIASALGGLVALRLIGCLGVAIVVACTAKSAGLIAGPRAARWAAISASALCTTPLLGTVAVNGELLASPFVAAGITATIVALKADAERRARLLAMAAGAAGLCALLIKQNFIDVFVFVLIAGLAAWQHRDIGARRCLRLFGGTVIGALIALSLACLVTILHGTSLRKVYDAMYPFRIAAGRTLDAAGPGYADDRLHSLLTSCLTSGLALLAAAILYGALTRRLRGAAVLGLLATLLFDIASIAIGGNFWTHYLVQAIVPVAILTGILIAHRQPAGRPLVTLIAAAAMVSSVLWFATDRPPTGTVVGSTIAASAGSDDTIVTAYGHADLDQASGLESPYQYLWSLPIKTRDPQLTNLNQVLSGTNAPTWFVTWNHITSWGLNSHDVAATLAQNYRVAGHVCGRTVYLRNGLHRPRLQSPTTCPDESVAATITKDELP